MAKRKRRTPRRRTKQQQNTNQRRGKIRALLRRDASAAFADVPVMWETIAALARYYPDADVRDVPRLIVARESAHRQGGNKTKVSDEVLARAYAAEMRGHGRYEEREIVCARIGRQFGLEEKTVYKRLLKLKLLPKERE